MPSANVVVANLATRAGHPIHYVPGALIHHLRAERGGTRSYGKHLTTVKPDHAVDILWTTGTTSAGFVDDGH